MCKFTKGTWKTAAPHEYIVYEDFTKDKLIIASEIEGYTEEEANANARLIAAAPEMYELLKLYGANPFFNGTEARKLLARIDGETNNDEN